MPAAEAPATAATAHPAEAADRTEAAEAAAATETTQTTQTTQTTEVARPAEATESADRALPRVLVGADIVVVERLTRLLAEQPALAGRVFTARELSYCAGKRRSGEHLAARFAAKEAVLKALGTGLGTRMQWTDVEVVNQRGGRPQVRLRGEVDAVARQRRMRRIEVSLSHVPELALANAALVCEGEDDPPATAEGARGSGLNG